MHTFEQSSSRIRALCDDSAASRMNRGNGFSVIKAADKSLFCNVKEEARLLVYSRRNGVVD